MRLFSTLGFLLICALPCRAHNPQISALKIIRTSGTSAVVSVSTHISKLLEASTPKNIDAAFRGRLKLRLDGKTFAPAKSVILRDDANDMATWQATYSGAAKSIEVLARLYPEDAASRFTVAVFENGRIAQQAVLDSEQTQIAWGKFGAGNDAAPERSTLQVAGAFLRMGVLHIFGGLDHICFILGLLLLGGSLKTLLKTVTAFTLAHSMTLILAVLKICAPSPRFIEPLIALSIVAVAAENLRPRRAAAVSESTPAPRDWRPFLAFGFGLVHGFGFAGALSEIGLSRAMLVPALASFNVGVEIGQMIIILAALPLVALLAAQSKSLHHKFVTAGSCAIALTGVIWFAQRVTGRF